MLSRKNFSEASQELTERRSTRRQTRGLRPGIEAMESRQLLSGLGSVQAVALTPHVTTPYATAVAVQVSSPHKTTIGGVDSDSFTHAVAVLNPNYNITNKWRDLQSSGVDLGKSISGVIPDGIGGYIQHFERGDIDWTPSTGAHEMHGTILAKWNSLQSQSVYLGHPTSDVLDDGMGGLISHFVGGDIDSTDAGTFEVHGDILTKWNRLRSSGLNLGHPTSDELDDGVGGKISHFQFGDIVYSDHTGTYEIHGDILTKWNELRASGAGLGHPTSDVSQRGWTLISHFEQGNIYSTERLGAHAVRGGVGRYLLGPYLRLSESSGPLGIPMDEETGPYSHRVQHFSNGAIHWFSSGELISMAVWSSGGRTYLDWQLRRPHDKVLLRISDNGKPSQVELAGTERNWYIFLSQGGRPYDIQIKGGDSREDLWGSDHWTYTDWSETVRNYY